MKNLLLTLFVLCTVSVSATVRMPRLFQSGMVLQRGKPIPVWGWADANETVTIRFNKKTYTVTADAEGHWRTDLPKMKAGGPYQLTINELTIDSVLIGDVWLLSGQSNIDVTIERVYPQYTQEIDQFNNNQVRLFRVQNETDTHGVKDDIRPTSINWKSLTKQNAWLFSAVGSFFGKRMWEKNKVPQGIIVNSWGGTPIEAWISIDSLMRDYPMLVKRIALFQNDNYVRAQMQANGEANRQWNELLNNCTWTWTTQNGVYGRKVTSIKNGNSIFLPAPGSRSYTGSYGYYWSSSLTSNPSYAWCVYFYSDNVYRYSIYRYYGCSVRPVMVEEFPVTEIELDKTILDLGVGSTEVLVATFKPYNATDRTVTWSSSNSEIATVDNTGKVTGIRDGSATITAKAGDKSAICSVEVYTVPKGAVDLGIVMMREDGSKYLLFWAECNIGASRPEEYGEYFAWGETEDKDNYSWSTYKWANGVNYKLTKYCPINRTNYWNGSGSPDDKTKLEPEDDVAHVKLGGKWRMPTDAEWSG